ncbi:MAG: ribosome maturation factor RimM [Cytophagales bacterium]|nr:ribosome maturation factor RimM [Cytophagales bacterium]
MKIDDCFKIAYVAKTHGLQGEVTFVLAPGCPDLVGLPSLFVETKGQLVPYFIKSVSAKGTKAFVKLEDVDSADAAALLRGCSVYLPRTLRPALPRGEFYNDEVVGFEVTDNAHGLLGIVKEIMENGANRHLIVNYLGREIMIPLNGPFIRNTNKSRKKITVELPKGFLEI